MISAKDLFFGSGPRPPSAEGSRPFDRSRPFVAAVDVDVCLEESSSIGLEIDEKADLADGCSAELDFGFDVAGDTRSLLLGRDGSVEESLIWRGGLPLGVPVRGVFVDGAFRSSSALRFGVDRAVLVTVVDVGEAGSSPLMEASKSPI